MYPVLPPHVVEFLLGEDDGLFFGGARPLGVAYTTPESVNGGYAQKKIAMFAAAGALRLVAIDEVHEVLALIAAAPVIYNVIMLKTKGPKLHYNYHG